MKLAILASLLAGAAAFAPVANNKAASTSALNASPDWSTKIGAQAPLGYFDPLGLLKDRDEATFDRLRALELKHGRVAQLAFLGNIVVLSGARFPGMLSKDIAFADMPSHGIEALSKVPQAGINQILAFIFCLEVGTYMLDQKNEFRGDYIGVTSLDVVWKKKSDEWKRKKMQIELNNGRAAMMGITGLIVHEQIGNLDSMPIIGH